jgi:hypothetical protein
MNYMGYKPSISPAPEAMTKTVETFTEPYHLQRDKPKPDYSKNKQYIIEEKKRINYFFAKSEEIPTSGIFPDVHPHLKSEIKLNIA